MKKGLLTMAVLTVALSFIGCKQEASEDSGFKAPPLPASIGTDEFLGKKIVNEREPEIYYSFKENNLVELYKESGEKKGESELYSVYKYAYDSENKKIYFQVYQLVSVNKITNEVKTYFYEEAIAETDSMYSKDSFIEQYKSKSPTALNSYINSKLGVTLTGSETEEEKFELFVRATLSGIGIGAASLENKTVDEIFQIVKEYSRLMVKLEFSVNPQYDYTFVDETKVKLTPSIDKDTNMATFLIGDVLHEFEPEDSSTDFYLSRTSFYFEGVKYGITPNYTDSTMEAVEKKTGKSITVNYVLNVDAEPKTFECECQGKKCVSIWKPNAVAYRIENN